MRLYRSLVVLRPFKHFSQAFAFQKTFLGAPVCSSRHKLNCSYILDITDGRLDFGLTTGEKLQIGFTLLAIGILIQALVCLCCCCIFRFARGFATGSPSQRPDNPVGGALYDVSAKYGNYVPGGAALGQPVPGQNVQMQGVPTAGVNQPPPQGYPSSGTATGYGQPYTGATSYDSPAPGAYTAPQPQAPTGYGAPPAYSTPYGNAGPGSPTAYPPAV